YYGLRATWLGPRAAGALTAGALLGVAGVVAVHRLLLTSYTGPLVVALALALLAALGAELATRGLGGLAGWRVAAAVSGLAGAGRQPRGRTPRRAEPPPTDDGGRPRGAGRGGDLRLHAGDLPVAAVGQLADPDLALAGDGLGGDHLPVLGADRPPAGLDRKH